MSRNEYRLMEFSSNEWDEKRPTTIIVEGYGDYFKNWGCHLRALGFNPPDLAQYFFSLDNFFIHLKVSTKPITHLTTPADRFYLAAMIGGGICVLISNQLAYYILNKERREQKEQKIMLRSGHRQLMLIIAGISIIYKSLATASSYFALLHDYTSQPYVLWINSSLAFCANVLAQSAIQGVTGNWHAGWKRWIAWPIARILSIYYTGSVLALNWNGIDNACLTFGLFDSRPEPGDSEFALKIGIVVIFFTCTLVRTRIVYFNRMYDRLLSEGEHQVQERSRFHVVTGYIAGWQRAGCMLLALAALAYDWGGRRPLSIVLTVGSSLLCCIGTLKSNLAVFLPKEMTIHVPQDCSRVFGALSQGFSRTRQALFGPRIVDSTDPLEQLKEVSSRIYSVNL